MKIHPRFQLRPSFIGERRVYNLLSGVSDPIGFAVHSVNLPEHDYKRWGEADFVLVTRAGLTLLEVKGGFVSYSDREWQYCNAREEAIRSTEGPARQAMSAAIALEKMLLKALGKKVRSRWGVVFPLCSFAKELPELPPSRLADNKICNDKNAFSAWLDAIPFDQHSAEDFGLTDDDIQAVRDILLPEFSATASLGLTVQASLNNSIQWTKVQYETLENSDANPRICISGGAGTGKTELAVMFARAERAAGRHPAFITRGKSLALALRSRLASSGIPVTTGSVPKDTDCLIVDEGQDFAHPEDLEALFHQLPGGLANGRWRWFMDPNLQFAQNPPDPESIKRLTTNSFSVNLKHNVRSTMEIVECIRTFLNADIGISRINGYGIRVRFTEAYGPGGESKKVKSIVEDLVQDGIQPREIAILGARGMDGAVCRLCAMQLPEFFRPLTPEGGFSTSSHGVVCGIQEYRGFESRVVILVDLDDLPSSDQSAKSLLYTGMSRATAALHLLLSPTGNRRLKGMLGQTLEQGDA